MSYITINIINPSFLNLKWINEKPTLNLDSALISDKNIISIKEKQNEINKIKWLFYQVKLKDGKDDDITKTVSQMIVIKINLNLVIIYARIIINFIKRIIWMWTYKIN